MAPPTSPLSLAATAIADKLKAELDPDGDGAEQMHVLVGSPKEAHELAKPGDKDYVNLFFYRVAHSGFHAAATSNDPLMLRVLCLVTPFARRGTPGTMSANLELIGKVIRYFHSVPLTDKFSTAPGPDGIRYRLECTLLQPNMEELNHIWTTQGSEPDYRLSAVYEFSLWPIQPIEPPPPVRPVEVATLDLYPSTDIGLATRDGERRGYPPAAPLGNQPAAWLPVMMLRQGKLLSNVSTVEEAATSVPIALAGLPGEHAAIDLVFEAPGEVLLTQTTLFRPVNAENLDAAAARDDLPIERPANAQLLKIRARPARRSGGGAIEPIPGSALSNLLTVSFAA